MYPRPGRHNGSAYWPLCQHRYFNFSEEGRPFYIALQYWGYFTTDIIWAYLKRSPVLLQTKWEVGTKPDFFETFDQNFFFNPDH